MDALLIRKLLLNNYLLLTFISYIYLLYKINNNYFKELITYIIVLFLFYIYFNDLKKSYIIAFFVLLIRLIFKNLFNNVENFGDLVKEEKTEKDKEKEIINKMDDDADKNKVTEDEVDVDEFSDIEEDDVKTQTQQDNIVGKKKNNVNREVDAANIDTTI